MHRLPTTNSDRGRWRALAELFSAANIHSYPGGLQPRRHPDPAIRAGSTAAFSTTHFVREGDDTRAMRAPKRTVRKDIE